MPKTGDMASERIARAKAYVSASNDHDLSRIEKMLAADCFYQSSGVGQYQGVSDIIAMMRDFFGTYPDVRWRPSDFHLRAPECVQFNFIIVLPKGENSGVERLFFDGEGRVRGIQVER